MYRQGTALATEIQTTQPPEGCLAFWYLGQTGILFKSGESTVAVDPYLSYYVDEHVSLEEKIWVRNYPPPLPPAGLGSAGLVLLTHAHLDHTDPETLRGIYKNGGALFAGPPSVTAVLYGLGIPESRIVTLRAGKPFVWKGVRVLAYGVAHDVEHFDEEGNFLELSYHIRFENGLSAYHSGDFSVTPSLLQKTAGLAPNIAFLPINGTNWKQTQADIIGNINAAEAADFAEHLNADLTVPVHFDLYPVNGCNPAHFTEAMFYRHFGRKHHIMQVGERFIYMKG
ncbi:MAG: MBL fold metallo-hydrolase [Oscillospiraceae bacterium]